MLVRMMPSVNFCQAARLVIILSAFINVRAFRDCHLALRANVRWDGSRESWKTVEEMAMPRELTPETETALKTTTQTDVGA